MLISSSTRNYFRAIGMSLILLGSPLGMYMNFFISQSSWSNIIMTLGVLLIIDYENLARFRFPSFSKMYITLIFYQIVCLFYYGFATFVSVKYLSFHLFSIALFIALLTTRFKESFSVEHINKIIWGISFICSLLFLFTLETGIFELQRADEDRILDPITMASMTVTNILSSIMMNPKKQWANYLMIDAVLLDLYCMIHTGKRTFLFISIIALIAYVWKYNLWRKVFTLRNAILTAILIAAFITIFIKNREVNQVFTSIIERFFDGIDDMRHGTTKSGDSAIARYIQMNDIKTYIFSQFSWLNFFIGAGYMRIPSDLPWIQCYFDMGIFGFYIFWKYVVIMPIITFFKVSRMNKDVLFASFICFPTIFQIFNAGTPYFYKNWTAAAFLIFVLVNIRNKNIQHKKLAKMQRVG